MSLDDAINEVRALARLDETGLDFNEAEANLECPNCCAKLRLGVSSPKINPTDYVTVQIAECENPDGMSSWRPESRRRPY